jgi:hypothetical protein
MKKIVFALIALTLVFSCQDDVEINQPAFQGIKDGDVFWKASSYSATISDTGVLVLTGTSNAGTLTLEMPYPAVRDYPLGDVSSMVATFTEFGSTFSTNNDGVGSVVYVSDGLIKMDEIDYNARTFTGQFYFNAYNASGNDVVNFIDGIFYKLPLSSGTIPDVVYTCEDATVATETAETTFDNTDVTDSDAYEANCAAYAAAIQNQMQYCGSEGLTEILEALGDCSFPCELAETNALNAQLAYNNAVIGTYIQACQNYAFFLGKQIEYCGDDADGSLQAIIDGLNCVDTDNDGVADIFEDINGDGDPTNDDTDLDLNVDYLDDDDDDDGVLTANELMFDEDGNPLDTDSDGIFNYLDTDDDGDGIPTVDEDINGDGDYSNDDTDGDGIPNYLDNDDDGDTILTQYEDLNADGNFNNDDTDADGTPNYLDNDDDGDSVFTMYEVPDQNDDGNPADAVDFDADGTPNYLDNDDDNDGILTIDENPDPNGDGNPDDAQNADADAFPDYLDA